ncbi:MAG TPA: carbohydrate binding family 9 domain-containing protein, partial [Gemmatimonadales bacterium]|nr:carbohydrate binding family 9 domain-containing protein [Gemmatimonadales bacterium]
MRRRLSALLTALILPASQLVAQGGNVPGTLPAPASYRVAAATGPIKVDGRLDDGGWQGTAEIPIDFEYTPGNNVAPPVRSICRLTYDRDNLYIGCVGLDPDPGRIRARLFDRDNTQRLVLDDHFVFLIDPFNDQRRAFQFRVNALGAQADAVLSTAEGYEDFSWDAIWTSAGRLTGQGFEVEIAIPFRSLRFPKTDGVQTWGFLFERSWPRDLRHRMQSAPRDRSNACLLCEANKVTGFQGITPGRNV